MSDKLVSLLGESTIFNGVSKEELEKLAAHPDVKIITLKQGGHLYRRGDPADKFWLILSGNIVAQTNSLRHPFHSVAYHVGSVTGLKGILEPGEPRPVSVVADSDSEFIEVPGDVIRKLDIQSWATILENVGVILLDKLLSCRSNFQE